ncbi:MAG: hypothetical protein AAFR68_18430 [Pseudomonadota bacterium]
MSAYIFQKLQSDPRDATPLAVFVRDVLVDPGIDGFSSTELESKIQDWEGRDDLEDWQAKSIPELKIGLRHLQTPSLYDSSFQSPGYKDYLKRASRYRFRNGLVHTFWWVVALAVIWFLFFR